MCEQNIQEDYVNSSVIKSYYWNSDHQYLIVEFQDGLSYEYSRVPYSVVAEWAFASSKGQYFNDKIKCNYSSYSMTPHT